VVKKTNSKKHNSSSNLQSKGYTISKQDRRLNSWY